MNEKIQTSVYLLKNEVTEFSKKHSPKNVEINSDYLEKHLLNKKYVAQKINNDYNPDYDMRLYHKSDFSEVKWKSFISTIAIDGEPILENEKLRNESFILFLKNKSTNKIFAISGGYGYTTIKDLHQEDFGMNILSRIVKKDERMLRAAKERNLTGNIFGSVKYFRGDLNLYENKNFGNFYQEIQASLDEKVLYNIFGFSKEDIKRKHLCIAKNDFKIKKSVSFDQLISIIKKIEYLFDNTDPIIEINDVIKLNKKGDAFLINKLNDELFQNIINIYNTVNFDFDIEVSHRDFDRYNEADTIIAKYSFEDEDFEIKFDETFRNINQLIEHIKINHSELTDSDIIDIIKNTHVKSIDSNGKTITLDSLIKHLSTELVHNSQSYFLLNNEWFQIKPTFNTDLNEHCKEFIPNNKYSGKLKKWKNEDKENAYNLSYLDENNTLVFDKFTPENIEVCDVMHWDDINIYFLHNKEGFNNSMRDLSQQIFISARKVKEDIKANNKNILAKLYDRVKNNQGGTPYFMRAKKQLDTISKSEFLALFDTRNVVFVLGVLDSSSKVRKLENIEEFDSCIAKFALHSLVNQMKILDVDLKIAQLEAA